MFVFELGIYGDWVDRKHKWKPEYTRQFVAGTASKAKYQYFQYLSDIYDWEFGDFVKWVYCKKIGVAGIHHMFGDREKFETVCQHRGITFAYQGMKIEVDGQMGTIVGGNSSANFDVVFDGEWRKSNCHPYWETVYFDRSGNIVADYRAGKVVGS